MSEEKTNCVLLAARHHGFTEGVRGLLDSVFETVVMVADENSLLESARRMHPRLVLADLSLVRGASLQWLGRVRKSCPGVKILVISVHDEPSVRRAALHAGADGLVLNRAIATDLIPAIEELLSDSSPTPVETALVGTATDEVAFHPHTQTKVTNNSK